jgi:hypothetical protein
VLLEMFREAKAGHGGDPVAAWAEITGSPELAARYKRARGTGGFVRAGWDEAVELAAAAYVHTIRTWGPDRIAAFSPIPAMSMVSHAAGARFHTLIGAPLLSFYDWYADLPVASPQVFGDQTDVPESGDWWDASYLVLWGSNVSVTRTPDAHWMAEARYRGQSAGTSLRLPARRRAVFPQRVLRPPGYRPDRLGARRVPDPRDAGLDAVRRLAVHPSGARVQRAGRLPDQALHRVPLAGRTRDGAPREERMGAGQATRLLTRWPAVLKL